MPNESLRMIADRCGVDTAMNIWENFGGLRLDIPTKPSGQMIVKAYRQGMTTNEVAEVFGVSERTIRRHIKI